MFTINSAILATDRNTSEHTVLNAEASHHFIQRYVKKAKHKQVKMEKRDNYAHG